MRSSLRFSLAAWSGTGVLLVIWWLLYTQVPQEPALTAIPFAACVLMGVEVALSATALSRAARVDSARALETATLPTSDPGEEPRVSRQG